MSTSNQRATRFPVGDGTEAWHGTHRGYTGQRCGCTRCRRAWAAYQAAWKAGLDPLPPGDRRHGTLNGYVNYGCRCESCRRARSRGMEIRRRAIVAGLLGGAPGGGEDPS